MNGYWMLKGKSVAAGVGVLLLSACLGLLQARAQDAQQTLQGLDASTRSALMGRILSGEINEATLTRYADLLNIPPDELESFREALQAVNENKTLSQEPDQVSELDSPVEEDVAAVPEEVPNKEAIEPKPPWEHLYGHALFSDKKISFSPQLNLPPPQDYRIGVADRLNIHIWGAHERTYFVRVNSQGYIKILRVGLIYVHGLTLSQARFRIRGALQKIYAGLRSTDGTREAYMSVSLSHIRRLHIQVIGEVKVPGAYTFPAYATLFNVLYYAGGPTESGSIRRVELIRNGRKIAELDVYRYMTGTDAKETYPTLRDQDIVRVPPFEARVQFKGAFKRQGWYEPRADETIADLLVHVGGFSSDAYRNQLQLQRNLQGKRAIYTVPEDEYSSFVLRDGDRILAEEVMDVYANRVHIQGAVFRPGAYALEAAPTVRALVAQAQGLRQEAATGQATLLRMNADQSFTSQSFSLGELMDGTQPDISLANEDMVRVYSLAELRAEDKVYVMGEVQAPGAYAFHQGLSLDELIAQAGGFSPFAAYDRVEVARLQSDPNTPYVLHIQSVAPGMRPKENDAQFELMAYDHVFVRKKQQAEQQAYVVVGGQVRYPGIYILQSPDETITDMVERAGGLRQDAYLPGAILYRPLPGHQGAVNNYLQELQSIRPEKEKKLWAYDSTHYEYIRLYQLSENRTSRSSKRDLKLRNGDRIYVPPYPQYVRTRGEVVHPSVFVFDKRLRVLDYIQLSGGYSDKAWRKKAYVRYANGRVARLRRYLFFKSYPKVTAGTEIFVPNSQDRRARVGVQEVIAVATSLGTLTLLTLNIINLTN